MQQKKLKSEMLKSNISVSMLCRKLAIDKSTFYRKLSGIRTTFSIREAQVISEILHLDSSTFMEIFFPRDGA